MQCTEAFLSFLDDGLAGVLVLSKSHVALSKHSIPCSFLEMLQQSYE